MARLARTTSQGAVGILEKLMDLFGMPELKVSFGCDRCPELYGCYFPSLNLICMHPENGTIPVYIVYHEFGHALEKRYTGDMGFSYAQGEGFARRLESIYLLTDGRLLDFRCECGRTQLRLLPDGDLECTGCGSRYYPELYPTAYNHDLMD